MGYRGKLEEQARARALRAEGETLADIAAMLGVSKGSVSVWVRDVAFDPRPRRRGRRHEPNVLQRRKAAEIERLLEEGRRRIGTLSEREFLVAGAALYAGEGSKGDGQVIFANSDPAIVRLFSEWLRHFFDVDESRLRVRLYLHEGLDLEEATAFWSEVTRIPAGQFHAPYRATADATRRHNKHERGCAAVRYGCSHTHRAVMGLVAALLSSDASIPG
jgi:transcriptional regulator with XRE-family HTH domain